MSDYQAPRPATAILSQLERDAEALRDSLLEITENTPPTEHSAAAAQHMQAALEAVRRHVGVTMSGAASMAVAPKPGIVFVRR